jgi:hypothetical protein
MVSLFILQALSQRIHELLHDFGPTKIITSSSQAATGSSAMSLFCFSSGTHHRSRVPNVVLLLPVQSNVVRCVSVIEKFVIPLLNQISHI